MNEKKEEILSLSLLRFFACLNIVVVHLVVVLLSLGYLPQFLDILSPYAQYGYLGVDLFFLISGFVITLSAEGRSAREFVIARFIRLYPMFWICVSITTVAIILFGTTRDISLSQFVANLTMSPDTFGGYEYIDGAYWTLAVELKFYIFIAFLLALKSWVKVNIEKVALFLSALLAVHAYLHGVHSTSVLAIILALFYSIFWTGYAQYFIAGILFYGLYRNRRQYYHYPALFVCYVIALVQAIARSYESNNKGIVVLYVTSFFLAFLLISFRKVPNEYFSFLGKGYKRILIILGASTYPLYLLHASIAQVFIGVFKKYNVYPYIAGPLLIVGIILLVLFVNRVDLYITKRLKQKLL